MDRLKRIYTHFMADSLYRNSLYLMLSTGVMAFFGFFFWILNARLYKPEQIGIATTLISVMTLISNFSLLGFNVALVRYLPKSLKKNEKISSALLLVILAAILASFIFLGGLRLFSPQLLFLQASIIYLASFVIFVIGSSLNTLVESIFLSYRSASFVLVKNVVLSSLKLALPLLLLSLGSYGIFVSVSLATLSAAIMGYIILILQRRYKPIFSFDVHSIKEMASFSGSNYLAGFFSQASTLILPILVINMIGAKTAAFYYIDSMIFGFLSIIPTAATQSLLAEGSYDQTKLKQHVSQAVKIIAGLLTPAVLIIALFGNILLHFFGKSYASDSFAFLQIISFSALFVSISSLGNAVLRVRHQMKQLIWVNFFGMLCLLGLAYVGARYGGLLGVGWAMLFGQLLSGLCYVPVFWKEFSAVKNLRLVQQVRSFVIA